MEKKVIRTVDELGRLALPEGFRRELKITEHSEVLLELKDGAVVMTLFQSS